MFVIIQKKEKSRHKCQSIVIVSEVSLFLVYLLSQDTPLWVSQFPGDVGV